MAPQAVVSLPNLNVLLYINPHLHSSEWFSFGF
jgi:hypothetical protein